ncbi:adenine phosphoribosyltransferase [Senna tora]|uniref:Adenine phosphoribosyltransferase n=1 Tax=Senna tora TaxID=362788 RepID=A0A834SGV0_9FABA|nr:adenine phosphoribosyltransferase [Senna tora]
MSRTVRSTPPLLFVFILLLTVAPTPSHSFYTSYYQYRNIISLAHSLMLGVANLRASRGDVAGSERARAIADKLESGLGLGFLRFAWSAGWDYATSFAWRELSMKELYGAVSDMNELLSGLSELTRLKSDAARAAWVGRNYQNVLALSKSLSRKLLNAFRKSEVVRKVVETVQREVVEGGLLKDCLELGSNDLKALILLLKDLAFSFSSSSSSSNSHSDL